MSKARNSEIVCAMTRDELLIALAEPLGGLSPEALAEAEALAVKDGEVARALRLCRALSGLDEVAVFGKPRSSDAQFVVALRERLEHSTGRAAGRGVFGTIRQLVLVGSICTALLAVVLVSGTWDRGTTQSVAGDASAGLASALESSAVLDLDSVARADVSPESLAVYLGVGDLTENWSFDDVSEQPLTDELLALDSESLSEVLNRLEATSFF